MTATAPAATPEGSPPIPDLDGPSAALALAAWRDGLSLSLDGLRRLAASNLGWLAAAFLALTFFETQNTGSLEYIGLWPILLLILLDWRNRSDRLRPVVLVHDPAVPRDEAIVVDLEAEPDRRVPTPRAPARDSAR